MRLRCPSLRARWDLRSGGPVAVAIALDSEAASVTVAGFAVVTGVADPVVRAVVVAVK